MKGTDALDVSTIFASVGALQASPPLGFIVAALSIGIAVTRRSPAVQELLLGEDIPESPVTRYFFKAPAKELPAPKARKSAGIALPETVDEAIYVAPRNAPIPTPIRRGDTQPVYPAPVQVRPFPTQASYQRQETIPQALYDGSTISVYLGVDRAGDPVYAPIKHGIIANSTGGGKTNTLDLIVGQLLALGVDVWAATPKYVPIDPSDKLPRHHIYDAIPTEQRALRRDDIRAWIGQAAAMVEARYTRMQNEPGWFPSPTVVILDELKAYLRVIGKKKDDRGVLVSEAINDAVQTILTLGRECGVFLVFTSQDGYCGSIEMTRGEIGNLGFRLVHPSLDENSQRNLLPPNVPSSEMLGAYDWYCARGNSVQVVSIPRVSLAMLTEWGLMGRTVPAQPATPQPAKSDAWDEWTAQLFANAPSEPDEVQALRFAIQRGKMTRVLALAMCGGDEMTTIQNLSRAGMTQADIAKLWKKRVEYINKAINGTLTDDDSEI